MSLGEIDMRELYERLGNIEVGVARIEERQIATAERLSAHDEILNGNGREGLKAMTQRLHEAHMRRDRHIFFLWCALVTGLISLGVAFMKGLL